MFSHLGHCTMFCISLFIFLSGYGWRLLNSLCFHCWDQNNHHLPENRLGGGSCGGGVSEQILLCFSLSQRTVEMHICLRRSEGYSIKWVTMTYSMSSLTPPCKPVRSRGALVPAFSPDGKLFAVVLNQRQPKVSVWRSSYAWAFLSSVVKKKQIYFCCSSELNWTVVKCRLHRCSLWARRILSVYPVALEDVEARNWRSRPNT